MATAATLLPLPQLQFETASEHLYTNVPIAAPDARAGEFRRGLVGRKFDTLASIAVCRDGRLLGLVTPEDLLAAPEDALVTTLMDADPPVVAPGLDQEQAAWKAVQHQESCLAVVDADRRFLGVVPPHRLLAVLLWEHDEDMARMGGFLAESSTARLAMMEAVARRFWHRIPWLVLGLLAAFFSADIVSAFEGQLEESIALAFFLPGIVYLADAVGTQTETLVVRGLSVGVTIRNVLRREVLTGALIGVALAGIFFPVVWWRHEDAGVAASVSLSLLAACSISTMVAMALPAVLHRLGRDPAYGSGPLATVVQDLLSIAIYFAISVALV